MNAHKLIITFVILFSVAVLQAQENMGKAWLLSPGARDSLLTPDVKARLGIRFPVFKAYTYTDKSGEYCVVLTERSYKPREKETDFNDTIQAFCFTKKGADLSPYWSLRDFILKGGDNRSEETSIWFFSKFMLFDDLDNDGKVDPVVVYGTTADNGSDDGRIRILVYYKGQKRAIRHQNSPYDGGRYTKVDAEYYDLPQSIQTRVLKVMEDLYEADRAIFPAGYKEKMKLKKTSFDEKK
ncbi:MAG: hypothetical protein V2A54_08180 [Bacteroidota bacterium]